MAPPPIRLLPEEVAARIAAGEVVERPASVVKELVENALDAGARRITVEVRGGGLGLVRVHDDGGGIDPEQLELAFLRHATSKLARPEDLLGVTTLGFRGEALPSIAAVAEVELISRPPESTVGAGVRFAYGELVRKSARAAAAGTAVTVRGLFARQPARLAFVRSRAGENAAISALLGHYAVAYPEVAFALTLDGREGLRTSGSGDPRQALMALYGPEMAGALLAMDSDGDGERDGPRVGGFLAPPHISRAGRQGVTLLVNRRWVQNRRLLWAVEEGYLGLLPRGRHPVAVVSLATAPEEVDVNVHPTKAEVRFREEGRIVGAVLRAVRFTLRQAAPVARMTVAPQPLAPAAPLQPSPLWSAAVTAPVPPAAAPPLPATPRAALPVLRALGQVGTTYLVAEGPDGMYLVDQHAAHERVLFEEIRGRLAQRAVGAVEVQALLDPVPLELTPAQAGVLGSEGPLLARLGFQLEPFGGRSYLLRALPAVLRGDPLRATLDYLDALAEEGDPAADAEYRAAAALACHGAVRAGQPLSSEEMRELLRRLEAAEAPHTCPHGRPTTLHLPAAALERQFRRR